MIEKIIVIDIGNSFIKLKHNDEVKFIHSNELALDNIKKHIETLDINSVVISSVDTDMEYKIVDFFANNNIEVLLADSLFRKQKFINFSNIQGMGNDRKLGLLGAIKFFEPPIITIDCGTAITINILSDDNICQGGIIMCGIGTQSRALSDYTSSLPKVKVDIKSSNINTTEDAINTGIISAVRGGIIDFIYNAIYRKKLENTSVIFTGGYGSIAFKLCRNKINKMNNVNEKIKIVDFKTDLVLLGLEKLLEVK